MSNIELWKLLVDIGVFITCAYFFIQLLRTQRTPASTKHIMELSAKLQGVVKEADETGRTLNEQLMRRQEQLEKLVFDVETIEHRLNRLLTSADETRGVAEIEINKAKQSLSLISAEVQTAEALVATAQQTRIEMEQQLRAIPQPPRATEQYEEREVPEPPSFEESVRISDLKERAAPAFDSAPHAGMNIFGEQFSSDQPAPRAEPERPQLSLKAHIEKVIEQPQQEEPPLSELEDVYGAAENLLRAGQDLERVAYETSLPLEEVRMLKRIIEQDEEMSRGQTEPEEAEIPATSNDERLGVLGVLKRHVPFF